jgi:integrase
MRTFKTTLMQLPPNRKKSKEYRDKSIAEILRAAPGKRLGKTTLNNIVTNISSFFDWCVRHGHLKENYAKGLKLRTKNERTDAARAVFSRSIWRSSSSRGLSERQLQQPNMFWIPLLCAFTGARLESFCSCSRGCPRGGWLWVLDINENPDAEGKKDNHLKPASSSRLIPVHPVLQDLGFRRYHASVAKSGAKRLFPELKKIRNRYGHAVSNWFARFRKSIGLDSELHDLHAFRHTVIDFFKKHRIPKDVYSDVTGHAQEGTAESVYAKAPPSVAAAQGSRNEDRLRLGLAHLGLGPSSGNGLAKKRKARS